MSNAIENFVAYWHKLNETIPPYIHPDDTCLVTQTDFETNFLPVPINGNLVSAEIVILMLNPGLDEDDYKWEAIPEFREGLLCSLRQSHANSPYPFSYLDPGFGQSPAAGYWISDRKASPGRRTQKKLKALSSQLAQQAGYTPEFAQQYLANKVAILQLFPYHSKKFGRKDLLNKLPSCQQAKQLVNNLIQSGEKLIIVPSRLLKNPGLR
jgi:hypothetical protein